MSEPKVEKVSVPVSSKFAGLRFKRFRCQLETSTVEEDKEMNF